MCTQLIDNVNNYRQTKFREEINRLDLLDCSCCGYVLMCRLDIAFQTLFSSNYVFSFSEASSENQRQ